MSEIISWDGETSLGVGKAGTPLANELLDLVSENDAITTFKFLSNDGRHPQCSLTLPSVGKFLLIARVVHTADNEVLTILPLGRSAEEWRKTPFAHGG